MQAGSAQLAAGHFAIPAGATRALHVLSQGLGSFEPVLSSDFATEEKVLPLIPALNILLQACTFFLLISNPQYLWITQTHRDRSWLLGCLPFAFLAYNMKVGKSPNTVL